MAEGEEMMMLCMKTMQFIEVKLGTLRIEISEPYEWFTLSASKSKAGVDSQSFPNRLVLAILRQHYLIVLNDLRCHRFLILRPLPNYFLLPPRS